ncbi:MAG TPA: hypothetical protein PKC76_14820 [Saprospiraceae bacterium]|nr:hypothetical protein [Saprospiraceae bacterium]HMP25405.1 hypothetical protein [Saprospiraceae bacterium]
MMRLVILLAVLLCLYFPSSSQNLVPNPDFEDYYYCPPYLGQILASVAWDSPNNTTTDYFHRCAPAGSGAAVPRNLFGTREPQSGHAYAGVRTWIPAGSNELPYREYLSAPLLDTLQAGVPYELGFWVSPAESSMFFSDDIGLHLSAEPFERQPLYELEPHLRNPHGQWLDNTDSWKHINGFYTAKGGERYIIIGSFSNDLTMTRIPAQGEQIMVYYYIDNIMVRKCDIPDTTTFYIDTIICQKQIIQIGGQTKARTHRWEDGSDLPFRTVNQPGLYSLYSDFGCYQTSVHYRVLEADCNCNLSVPTLVSLSRPADVILQGDITDLRIAIYDSAGRMIRQLTKNNLEQLNNLGASGMYFWRAIFKCQNQTQTQQGKLVFVVE